MLENKYLKAKLLLLAFLTILASVQLVSAQVKPSEAAVEVYIDHQSNELLVLHDLGLTEFPSKLLQRRYLKQLDLQDHLIRYIPDSISNLERLNALSLARNMIEELNVHLTELPDLKMLIINDNRIPSLPPFCREMQALTSLNISRNPIGNQGLQNLPPNLEWLEIDDIQLSGFPEAVSALSALSVLYISDNQIEELPTSIDQLTQLKTLRARDCQMRQLPNEIGSLAQLKHLTLTNNSISSLPDEIGNLLQLKNLDLQNNKLSSLPDSISNLSSLSRLLVGQNQLKVLPTNFGELSRLYFLQLQDNQLTTLPESFANLSRLSHLNLANNQFVEVPEVIAKVRRLNFLDLSGNPIESIPEWLFTDLPALRTLKLSANLKGKVAVPAGSRIFIEYIRPPKHERSNTPHAGSAPTSKEALPPPTPLASGAPPPPPPPPPSLIQTPSPIDTTAVFDRVHRKPVFDNSYCNDADSEREQEKCFANSFSRFVRFHLVYPSEALRARKKGRVTVTFIVEKDGTVSNVAVAEDPIGYGCGDAAVNVINKMNSFGPMFIPGKHEGYIVRTRMTLEVPFYPPKGI